MPSFETLADTFTHLSVFHSPEGSSNTFKTHKNISLYFKRRYLKDISLYFKRRYLIIDNYLIALKRDFHLSLLTEPNKEWLS